jgi:dynein heavy chain
MDIEVPERASKLFDKVDMYRTQTGNLELCVNMYNEILATLLNVEKPLLADRIKQMGDALEPGISQLQWNSDNINKFIGNALNIVTTVDELVKKMKENVRKMSEMMEKWNKPLYERKNKAMLADDVEQMHTAMVGPRLEDIRTNGKEILKLMKDTMESVKPDKTSKTWRQYVDYLNGLVIEGITHGIGGSMMYLLDQLCLKYNRDHMLLPIFDIKVNLEDRMVLFEPSIICNDRQNGIRDIINKIVEDFISLATQMPRLDSPNGDYLNEIKDQFELMGQFQGITHHMNEIEDATNSFIQQYDDKKFLWEEELDVSFQAFLDSGSSLKENFVKNLDDKRTGEEGEDAKIEEEILFFDDMSEKILRGVCTRYPSLEVFDEKIAHLTDVKDRISQMKHSVDIGWLRVQSTPLIRELEKTICSWIEAHTSFLLNNTTKQIANIREFIDQVSNGIKVIPQANESEKEKKLLMGVMTHLRDVKTIKDKTLAQVEPMKQAILLMKKHQVKMDDDYLVVLENNKSQLVDVSERALGPVKEAILPLQNQEAQNIKARLARFSVEVQEFRIKFQNNCPFHVSDTNPEVIE